MSNNNMTNIMVMLIDAIVKGEVINFAFAEFVFRSQLDADHRKEVVNQLLADYKWHKPGYISVSKKGAGIPASLNFPGGRAGDVAYINSVDVYGNTRYYHT